MSSDGSTERLSLQQASLLMQREGVDSKTTKAVRKTKQQRTKKLKLPLSANLTQADLEAAAACLLAQDPTDSNKLLPVDQIRADEIKRKVDEIRRNIDQDGPTDTDQLTLAFFRSAARSWRKHVKSQNCGSETA